MNGSIKLAAEEIAEMIADAADSRRGEALRAARALGQIGTFNDYIEFLSENIENFSFRPTPHVTAHYLL
jgi:hypothetical protein